MLLPEAPFRHTFNSPLAKNQIVFRQKNQNFLQFFAYFYKFKIKYSLDYRVRNTRYGKYRTVYQEWQRLVLEKEVFCKLFHALALMKKRTQQSEFEFSLEIMSHNL